MFRNLLKHELKCILYNKTIVIWNIVFPFLLAIFFYGYVTNMEEGKSNRTVNMGVSASIEERSASDSRIDGNASIDHLIRITSRDDQVSQELIYYFALIGITCILSAHFGIRLSKQLQADQTSLAIRQAVAPVKKSLFYISGIIVNYAVAYFQSILLLFFLKYMLDVPLELSVYIPYLICGVGVLCGLKFGICIGCIMSKNDLVIENLTVGLIVLGGLLSGLLRPEIRYYITSQYGWLAKLNPVELVTDSFYSMYYYGDLKGCFIDIGMLLAYAILFFVISMFYIRRKTYEHI